MWSSSDTSVATVENGLVTAVGVGSCTITATSGSYSDTCSVVVSVNTYLTGTVIANTLTDPNQSGNNNFTKTLCNIGYAGHAELNGYLTMLNAVQSYDGELLCASLAINKAESGYNFQMATPTELTNGDAGTNQKHVYDNIGYPVPMAIPTGTAKIKCIGLSESYGARAIFFDTTTRAFNSNENVNGSQYYCANRKKYTETASDYTWSYENNLEFEVPSGYNAVVVVWKTDPNDSEAVLPINMTAEQLAAFKVQCLSE